MAEPFGGNGRQGLPSQESLADSIRALVTSPAPRPVNTVVSSAPADPAIEFEQGPQAGSLADRVRQVLTAPDSDLPIPETGPIATPEQLDIAGGGDPLADLEDTLSGDDPISQVRAAQTPDIPDEPEGEQVGPLPEVNQQVVEILNARRDAATGQARTERERGARDEALQQRQPNFIQRMFGAKEVLAPSEFQEPTLSVGDPSSTPAPESSIGEQFIQPWINRKREIYGMIEGPFLDDLAGKIVGVEAAYRRQHGIFNPGQVERVTGVEVYADLPDAVREHWRNQDDFFELLRSSWYQQPRDTRQQGLFNLGKISGRTSRSRSEIVKELEAIYVKEKGISEAEKKKVLDELRSTLASLEPQMGPPEPQMGPPEPPVFGPPEPPHRIPLVDPIGEEVEGFKSDLRGQIARIEGPSPVEGPFNRMDSLEEDIHTDLLSGLPMVSDEAGNLAIEYYKQLARVTPEQIPQASGFFQKLASGAGHLGPFITELAMARRLLPIGRAQTAMQARIGAKAGETIGKIISRGATEGALFGGRAMTVEGGEPVKEAVFGAILGGTQAAGKAVGLGGKQGSNLAAASGEAVATSAVFGTSAALAPGSDATDVLIGGVIAPLMFHGRDLIRHRFSPKALAIRYRTSINKAGRLRFHEGGGELDLPADWRGLRDRPDASSQLIYRYALIGTKTPADTDAIKALGEKIQERYVAIQNGDVLVTVSEGALIHAFVSHYSPEQVFARAAEARAGSGKIITPPSFVEPGSEKPSQTVTKPSQRVTKAPVESSIPSPEPTQGADRAQTERRLERPRGKRGAAPEPLPPEAPKEADIIERPFSADELNAQGESIERRLLRSLPAKPQIRGKFSIAWGLGRQDPAAYQQDEAARPDLREARLLNIRHLERLNAQVLREQATAGGRKRQLLAIQTGQITEALHGLTFDRPDRPDRPDLPTTPEELSTADDLSTTERVEPTGKTIKARVKRVLKPGDRALNDPLAPHVIEEIVSPGLRASRPETPSGPGTPVSPTQGVTLPAKPAAGASQEGDLIVKPIYGGETVTIPDSKLKGPSDTDPKVDLRATFWPIGMRVRFWHARQQAWEQGWVSAHRPIDGEDAIDVQWQRGGIVTIREVRQIVALGDEGAATPALPPNAPTALIEGVNAPEGAITPLEGDRPTQPTETLGTEADIEFEHENVEYTITTGTLEEVGIDGWILRWASGGVGGVHKESESGNPRVWPTRAAVVGFVNQWLGVDVSPVSRGTEPAGPDFDSVDFAAVNRAKESEVAAGFAKPASTPTEQRIRTDLAVIGQPALPGLEDAAAAQIEVQVRRLVVASDMLEVIPDNVGHEGQLSIEDVRDAYDHINEEFSDVSEGVKVGPLLADAEAAIRDDDSPETDKAARAVIKSLDVFGRDATIGEIRQLMDILAENELPGDFLVSQVFDRVSALRKRAEADLSLVRGTIEKEATDGDRGSESDAAVTGEPERPGSEVLETSSPGSVSPPGGGRRVRDPPDQAGGGIRAGDGTERGGGLGPGTGGGAAPGDVVSAGGGVPGRGADRPRGTTPERGGGALPATRERPGSSAEVDRPAGDAKGVHRQRGDIGERPEAAPDRSVDRPRDKPVTAEPTAEGEAESPQDRPSAAPSESPVGERLDYVIAPEEITFPAGEAARIDTNLEVIKILRDLESNQQTPSDAERRLFIQYSGWGPNRSVFKGQQPTRHGDTGRQMAQRFQLLEEMLSDEDMASAKRSNQYAFFTPPAVARAMWSMVERYGYTGGRVFEPGMGVGVFFGTMPTGMRPTTKRVGLEMDGTSVKIAEFLYPSSKIMHTPFEDAALPNNYFDLIIGNPPFANIPMADIRYPSRVLGTVHDYFFVRSLDLLRPGGLQVFIVSDGLMNKMSTSVRQWIADRANLVGAVRLNNTMLDGTKATADIIVLRKLHEGERPSGERWLDSKPMAMADPDGVDGSDRARRSVNEYYHRHPENVMGEFQVGSLYGNGEGPTDSIVVPSGDKPAGLRPVLESLPEINVKFHTAADSVDDRDPEDLIPAPKNMPVGTFAVEGDTLRQVMRDRTMGSVEKQMIHDSTSRGSRDAKALKAARTRVMGRIRKIKKLVNLRDSVLDFQRAMLNPESEESTLAEMQKAINTQYDEFVSVEGPIHKQANASAVMGDAYTRGVVLAIEKWNKSTKKAAKGDIFTTRILEPAQAEIANTVDEALAVSLNESPGGQVDLARIADILQEPVEKVKQEMIDNDLAYELPDGRLQTRDEYLSGDSRGKLEEAKAAAALDKRFDRNVAAIEKIVPADLGIDKIKVQLGAVWIPVEVYQQFADQLFPPGVKISFLSTTGRYLVVGTGRVAKSIESRDTWGTSDVDGVKILEHAMKFTEPVVRERIPDDRSSDPRATRVVINEGATKLAQSKLRLMREKFEQWIWEQPERVVDLLPRYNRANNSQVPRQWSGTHLKFPGMSPFWRQRFMDRDYQPRTVWRAIASPGNLLVNGAMGSGKTAIGSSVAMELRRRGIARKPLIVVQNSTFEQFPAEFAAMYPTAKLYAVETGDMQGERRVRAFADIALGDWDSIIMPHSTFELIPAGEETVRTYFGARIKELEEAIEDARVARQNDDAFQGGLDKKGRSRDPVIREIEKQKEKLENHMKKRLQRLEKHRAIGGLTFEEMGIDYLIIDEAQKYKNLGFATSATRIKGMSNPSGNQTTFAAHMKIEHIQRLQNGKGLMFMTGTPITNTMTEAFIMQRYLQPEVLRAKGIHNIDSWLKQFGVIEVDTEKKTEGSYGSVTRLRALTNKTDLMRDWLTMTETITQQDMVEKYGVVLPLIAKNETGERGFRMHKIKLEGQTRKFLRLVEGYAKWIRDNYRAAKEAGENFLVVTTMMKDGAFDLRQVSDQYTETENHKIKETAKQAVAKYKELTGFDIIKHNPDVTIEQLDELGVPHDNGKINGVQLIFLDRGINPRPWGFHGYGDLIDRLVAGGIPRNEIAVIHEWDKRRTELFTKVNAGEIRIVVGTTEKMGIGVNVQRLLGGMHFVVPPWRPDFMSQAVARGIRPGNLFREVELNIYAMEEIDEYFYQILFAKMKFLDQFNDRELDEIRESEEPSLDSLTYAQLKALTTGNPHIVPHEQAKQRVSDLVAERQGFLRQVSSLVNEKKQTEHGIAQSKREQANLKTHIDYMARTEGRPFEMMIGDSTFDKSEAAGQAILQELIDLSHIFGGIESTKLGTFTQQQSEREIGTYRGYRIMLKADDAFDGSLRMVPPGGLGLHPTSKQWFKWANLKDMDTALVEFPPKGLVQRIRNAFKGHEAQLTVEQANQTKLESDLAKLGGAIEGKQWAQETELAKARDSVERLRDLVTAHRSEESDEDRVSKEEIAELRKGVADVEKIEDPSDDVAAEDEEAAGGAKNLPDFPPGPASLRPGSVFPSHFTGEMKRYVRGKLDPTKPGYGMGAMANMPDPLSTYRQVIDRFVERLENAPKDSRFGRVSKYFGRGLYGDQWGLSEEMHGYFRRVKGAERIARFDSSHTFQRFLRERRKQIQYDYGKPDGGAIYRKFEKQLADVIDGKEKPETLTDDQRKWFESLKARIDGITEDTLKFPEQYLAAFGLRNIAEVIRERMLGTGTHLRALYIPASQFPNRFDEKRKEIRLVGRGPRIRGAIFKVRRSDKGVEGRETWTLGHADGTFTQFFNEPDAFEAYQAELNAHEKSLGESRFQKITLQDSFDRDMVATLQPVEDLATRVAATITLMEHNLATLKLFDYIDATHAMSIAPGEEIPDNYEEVPNQPEFGPIAGKFVDHHIMDNLMDFDRVKRGMMTRGWNAYHYIWKSLKTIWNAGTWKNNALGNLFFNALAGQSPMTHPKFFARASREILAGRRGEGQGGEGPGAEWRYLVKENWMNVGFHTEFFNRFAEMMEQGAVADPHFDGRLWELMEEMIPKLQAVNEAAGQAYDFMDQVSIMVKHMRNLADGMSREESVTELWMFPNYANAGKFANWARNHPLGSSFIMFSEQSAKIMLRAVRSKPGSMFAMMALPGFLTMLSAIILGVSDEEWKIWNTDFTRKGSWGVERWLNRYFQPMLPIRSKDGKLQALDVRWSFPLANDFRVDMGAGGIGTSLFLNTPLARGVLELVGVDLYTGRRISPEEHQGMQRFTDHMLNFMQEVEPLPRMVTRTWKNLWRVIQGDDERSWWEALLNGVFGTTIRVARLNRREVFKVIQAEIGSENADAWLKMAEIYNSVYRSPESRPISPRAVLRGKVIRQVNEERKEERKATRRARIRREKARP